MMTAVGVIFDRAGVSREKIKIYAEALADVPLDALLAGGKKIIKTRIFQSFPTPGEFREAALGSVRDDIAERGLLAWDTANRSVITGAINAEPDEADRIERAINLAFGGRSQFGMTDPDADAFDRKHFLECYRIVAEKEERSENLLEQLRITREQIAEMRPDIKSLEDGLHKSGKQKEES
jgi:hypothetical protein